MLKLRYVLSFFPLDMLKICVCRALLHVCKIFLYLQLMENKNSYKKDKDLLEMDSRLTASRMAKQEGISVGSRF